MPPSDALAEIPRNRIFSAKVIDQNRMTIGAGFATLMEEGEHYFEPDYPDSQLELKAKFIVIERYPPVALATFRRSGKHYAFTA